MKILTKKWAEKHELVRGIQWLKEYDEQKESYEDIKKKSFDAFYHNILTDTELSKAVLKENLLEKLYNAKVEQDKKVFSALPQEVFSKIKNVETLYLGFASKEDKAVLTTYSIELLKELEKKANMANSETETAQKELGDNFTLDDIVGELVYEEFSTKNDYHLIVGGQKISIENYQIVEREEFKINEWKEDNPLTLWTSLYAAELHHISKNRFELHLLLVDGDKYENKTFWYFTLSGTNIKIQN